MSQMLQEMREQPILLESRAESLFEQARVSLSSERPQLIVFAARGSSDHACIYGKYLIVVKHHLRRNLAVIELISPGNKASPAALRAAASDIDTTAHRYKRRWR